jgi:hypothetical protein
MTRFRPLVPGPSGEAAPRFIADASYIESTGTVRQQAKHLLPGLLGVDCILGVYDTVLGA